MNIQKTSFRTESAYKSMLSESIVEGRLSLPVEKNDIQSVLLVHGRVHASAMPSDDKVFMDGDVVFSVVYLCTDGSIDSFEASSPFRHSEDAVGADSQMNVYVKGSIKEVEFSIEDSRAVYVKGIVSISMYGSILKSYDAISTPPDEMQVKMYSRSLAYTKEYKSEVKTISEDIRVPQAQPRVEKILLVDAYAVVKSVKTEELKVIVEGDIKMMILYLSEDKNAPLQHFYESMPFGEILACESVSENDNVIADAEIYDLSVNIADEDILRINAKLDVICSIKSSEEKEFVQDAYSLTSALSVSHQKIEYRNTTLNGCVKAITRCAITVPEEKPSVSRVIFMKACPVIATCTAGVDRVYIEGLMMYTVCYTSPDGMQSYSSEVPFEAEAQMEGLVKSHEVNITAEVEYCSFEGAGRDLSVKFMMDVNIKAYEIGSFSLVEDIEQLEEPLPIRRGITIYFTDGGESVWDIAKRYSTTQEIVEKFNPDISECAEQGQKILIMA